MPNRSPPPRPAPPPSYVRADLDRLPLDVRTALLEELAKHVLERGYHTVVTARHPDEVGDLAAKGETLLLTRDVTDQDQIDVAIKTAEARCDRIGVLVTHAGIGYCATGEEREEDQVRRRCEINVFGLSRMIRATLSGMRKRRQGFIVNVSSTGGLRSFPSVGYSGLLDEAHGSRRSR